VFEQAFKNIDDVLWKEAGCTTELDYTEQTSWLLFLKYLDGLEQDRADEAALEGKKYTYILDKPYRWESWAAPKGKDGKLDHNTALTGDDLRDFVNQKLFPYLHGFKQRATGTQDAADLRGLPRVCGDPPGGSRGQHRPVPHPPNQLPDRPAAPPFGKRLPRTGWPARAHDPRPLAVSE